MQTVRRSYRFGQRSLGSRRFITSYGGAGVGLVGAPFRGGQPRGGVEDAPARVREFGVADRITELGWKLTDYGDVEVPPQPAHEDKFNRVLNPLWAGKFSQNLAEMTSKVVENGDISLVVGGDHSIAVGSIAGAASQHPDLGVIWVDAHADINTAGSTPSGNMHGMPLSFLTGLTPPVPGFEWIDLENPALRTDQLVYIGLRDLEHEEKMFLREHRIKAFDMHDVDKYGIGQVMDMADHILGNRPLHLSFDIDALDPSEAPSTGTRVRGGLSFREGNYVCEYVHNTGRMVSMDLVEINPALGSKEEQDLTVATGVALVKSALGEKLT